VRVVELDTSIERWEANPDIVTGSSNRQTVRILAVRKGVRGVKPIQFSSTLPVVSSVGIRKHRRIKLSFYNHFKNYLAERVGFEPTWGFHPLLDFESSPLWPLRYLSGCVVHFRANWGVAPASSVRVSISTWR
jgi:hypothetical protein